MKIRAQCFQFCKEVQCAYVQTGKSFSLFISLMSVHTFLARTNHAQETHGLCARHFEYII